MASFVPYAPSLEANVDRYNKRIAMAAEGLVFPKAGGPFHDPSGKSGIALERLVALDLTGEMRAGYLLKHQPFRLGSAHLDIANVQGPTSEGMVDHAFATYGIALVRDALKRTPMAYSLGMGGMTRPYPRILAALKWQIFPVPFFFKVVHPYRFCRRIRFLRNRLPIRIALDLLAFSGLGSLGIRLANARARFPSLTPNIRVERVDGFAPWADRLLERCESNYGMLALREARVLDFLYGDSRFIRLRVDRDGIPVGWGIGLLTSFEDHKQFGALRVGSLVDCMAERGAEPLVVAAMESALRQEGADLLVTNQSHGGWTDALARAAYFNGPSNFLLALSPSLWGALEKAGIPLDRVHMNRGDGDGPINL